MNSLHTAEESHLLFEFLIRFFGKRVESAQKSHKTDELGDIPDRLLYRHRDIPYQTI
jgi:hypothetical protein